MTPFISVRLIRGALAFFAAGAALGAAFALAGPAPFVRLLGLVALAGGAAGCLVQIYALRTFAPEAYAGLRARAAATVANVRHAATAANRSTAPGSPTPAA